MLSIIATFHDDVIKWKHFPRYWRFVRIIHRSPLNSPLKGQWHGALIFCLICAWINGWVKQSWDWWLETHSRPLWRHCNAMPVNVICNQWDIACIQMFCLTLVALVIWCHHMYFITKYSIFPVILLSWTRCCCWMSLIKCTPSPQMSTDLFIGVWSMKTNS